MTGLFLVAAVVSSSAFADVDQILFEAELRQEVQARLYGAARKCVLANIRALPCVENTSPGNSHIADPEAFQVISEAALTGLSALPTQEMALAFESPDPRTATSDVYIQRDEAKKVLARVGPAFARVIREDKYDRCHAVCLVQCFVSNSIAYDDEVYADVLKNAFQNTADMGPDETAGTGKGLCRNYSTLAQSIAKAAGDVDLTRVSTSQLYHNVIGYKDGDKKFLVEMQSDPLYMGSCVRYPW